MGIISGYFGGIVDIVIMRIADMMISFPGASLRSLSPVSWAAPSSMR